MDPKIQQDNTIAEQTEKIPCPAPFSITLDAKIPNVVSSDFSPAHLANHQEALGYTGINKFYLHTFVWKPQAKCCQVTKAVLTVKLKANQNGTANGTNAGNDTISVIHAGASIAPYSEKVYSSWPFPAGQTAVKTWNLNPAAIANINTSKLLSFAVQDDTMVESATLQLSGCCLKLG